MNLIEVPRVRDRLRKQEVPLPTYERLQEPRGLDSCAAFVSRPTSSAGRLV